MSWITTVLVSVLSLGLGMLGGFGLLYQQYETECQKVLNTASAKAKGSVQQLLTQNEKLTASYNSFRSEAKEAANQCQDTQRQSMEAHSKLMEQHQKILKEHSDAVETIATLQKNSGGFEQALQKLQAERDALILSVTSLKESTNNKKLESLTSQLNMAQSMLQQKSQEVTVLEAQLGQELPDDDPSTIIPFAAMEKLKTLQSSIQRQHYAQTMLRYNGHQGPLYVKFDMAVVGPDPNNAHGYGYMIVELSTKESYSMTLGTFLNMLEADLYRGTILSNRGDVVVGGNPLQAASKRIQAQLTRRFAEYGWGLEPFLWMENADCDIENTDQVFWFPSLSSQFQIGTASPASCHGRVVQALSTLHDMLYDASRRNSFLSKDDPPVQVVIQQTDVLLELPPIEAAHEEL